MTARIWWPGVATVERRFLAVPAAAWATVTWWLVLGPPADTYTEQYSLPARRGGAARRLDQPPQVAIDQAVGHVWAGVPAGTGAYCGDRGADGDQWRWLAVTIVADAGASLLLRRRRARATANGV